MVITTEVQEKAKDIIRADLEEQSPVEGHPPSSQEKRNL